MKTDFKNRIFGIVLTAVSIVLSAVFFYIVKDSAFLTKGLNLLVLGGLAVFNLIVFLLSFNSSKKIRTTIATIITILMLLIYFVGSYFIIIGKNTLLNVTDPKGEIVEVSVFVRTEDKAQNLTDAKDYLFGILKEQDRNSVDYAINEIDKIIGKNISFKEFESIDALLDALVNKKEVNAIIINRSFIDLLDENEDSGYKDKLREVYTISIELEKTENVNTPVNNKNVFTIYISGVDCYGNVALRSRSDVNILMTVNVDTGQILLISTPRDFYWPLSISNGIPDKLTHAGIYGVNVSRDTVASIYGVDIDYYFKVNFDGFRNIVDALGGIRVVSKYNFTCLGYNYVLGENYLNGDQALGFTRNRYSFGGGDGQRNLHQMEVIRAIIEKATGPAIILNYKEVLKSVEGAFETDMPYEMITTLIQNQIKNGTKWNVSSYMVSGTGGYEKPYSLGFKAYVLKPNLDKIEQAKSLMNQIRNGEIPNI